MPTYQEQKKYYDSAWSRLAGRITGADELCRLAFITSCIKKAIRELGHKPKIIDLGCGRGWITKALSRYGDVTGVDLSTAAAQKHYPQLHFIQANIITDNIPGKYDVVVSSEVIEHLTTEDQQKYIRKAVALITAGGYLIMTTPNRPKTELLFREITRAQKYRQPVENWLDEKSLTDMLAHDFEVKETGTTFFCPIVLRKNRFIEAIYLAFYAYTGLYRLIDKMRKKSGEGLYLTAVGRRR